MYLNYPEFASFIIVIYIYKYSKYIYYSFKFLKILFSTGLAVCTLHLDNSGLTVHSFLYLFLQQNITNIISITLSKLVAIITHN